MLVLVGANSLSFFMPASRHFCNLQAGQWRLWALLTSQLPAKGQVRTVLLVAVRLWETEMLGRAVGDGNDQVAM